MSFDNASFIKPNEKFDKNCRDYAPLFRKNFYVNAPVEKAEMMVCGLGYAYYYLNGELISEDLFTAPFSNYEKTLWYNVYDVSELLKEGENILAVCCGNGWYNEAIPTVWEFHKAEWRDFPKFLLALAVNDKTEVISDESWKYTLQSPIIYNQLRVGERFDARLYDERWKRIDFDDADWKNVKMDDHPPRGVLRECKCEPIREMEEILPTKIFILEENRTVFDFGVNISGYAKLKVKQNAGDVITLCYAEEIHEDYSLNLNGMNRSRFYPEGDFQMDQFVCSGKEIVWSPRFTYHGFRYVEVRGLREVNEDTLTAVFVHQAVKGRSAFRCSDENLNKLFELGQRATLSNLFYMPTDCPTREKMGWMNDAQASADQMLTNFETERLLKKWWVDICDAMTPEGRLPGVVPTPGYGYSWGNGPVSDGALFEIPYQIYLHTGDGELLKRGVPYFDRYLHFLDSSRDEDGDICFGLDDWAAPNAKDKVDAKFINKILKVKFLRIRKVAAELCKTNTDEIQKEIDAEISEIKLRYLDADGTCTLYKQTAVAMLIYHGIYDDLEPLKEQLKKLVEEKEFHHDCGMVGLRHLYLALDRCGLQDYAYKIITAKGFPSFMDWLEDGATTLYEHWDKKESHNHHMYSDFMSWIIKTILGIRPDIDKTGYCRIEPCPYFLEALDYAEGYCNTVRGKIAVKWKRDNQRILLHLEIPEGVEAFYKGQRIRGKKELMV